MFELFFYFTAEILFYKYAYVVE